MKILFLTSQPGVAVRPFSSVLRLLAERGHDVRLGFQNVTRTESREELDRLLEAAPGMTAARLPRLGSSRWSRLDRTLGGTADYLRFLDPPFEGKGYLKALGESDAPAFAARLGNIAGFAGRRGIYGVRRATQALQRCLPPPPGLERYLADERPDLVLVSPLIKRGSGQQEWLRAAKRLGIRTVFPVFSWDNLTSKSLLRDLPDLVLVWNGIQVDEAVELHGVPRKAVRAVGAWSLDHWFSMQPRRTREEFCGEVGLRPDRQIILYVCSHNSVIRDELPFVRRWLAALRAHGELLEDAGVLVRPHPEMKDSAWLLRADVEDPQVAIWPRTGEDPASDRARLNYFESIFFADAVFGINTSAQIEAAIVDRPVHTLLADEFRKVQEETIHFHYLLNDEFGHLIAARTLEEHARRLETSLRGEVEEGRNARLVRKLVRPFGGEVPATPFFVDALEELAKRPAPAPDRGPRFAPAARLAMFPVAAALERHAARRAAAKPSSPAGDLRRTVRALAREDEALVVAGPWLGDPAHELLYWIPFLRMAQTAAFGLRERLWVVARSVSRPWYEGVGARLVVSEEVSEETLREAVGDQEVRFLQASAVGAARAELSRHEPGMPIPRRLLDFAPLTAPPLPPGVEFPEAYVAVAGLDDALLELLADRMPLVSLDACDSAVLGHAWGFVGGYGAPAVLAALLGTPAVCLYSEPDDVPWDDLRLARAFLGRAPFGAVTGLEVAAPEPAAERIAELLGVAAGALT